jgi:hypothetical protein
MRGWGMNNTEKPLNQTDVLLELLDDIAAKHKQALMHEIHSYPRERFYASDLHECNRYLYHSIIDWAEKPMVNDYVAALFKAGKHAEQQTISMLMAYGFEVVEGQKSFDIKHVNGDVMMRGMIDGMLKYKGFKYPFEHKLTNDYDFGAINCLDDFQKKPKLKQWLWQLMLYLYGNNKEMGFFMLTDGRAHFKLIPVYLEYELGDWLLKKLEMVWLDVKAKKPSHRIDYSDSVCSKCYFNHVCLPEMRGNATELVDDVELLAMLNEREELKPKASQYKKLDEAVKDRFAKLDKPIIVGTDFLLEPKEQKRMVAKVPDEIKVKYEVQTIVHLLKIINLNAQKLKGGQKDE